MIVLTGSFDGCGLIGVNEPTVQHLVSSAAFKDGATSSSKPTVIVYMAPELRAGLALREGHNPSAAISQWMSDAEAALALFSGAESRIHLVDAMRSSQGPSEMRIALQAAGVQTELQFSGDFITPDLAVWAALGDAYIGGDPRIASLARALDTAAALPSQRARGDRSAIIAAAGAHGSAAHRPAPIAEALGAFAARLAEFSAEIAPQAPDHPDLSSAEGDAFAQLVAAVDARAREVQADRGRASDKFVKLLEENRVLRLQLAAQNAAIAEHDIAMNRAERLFCDLVDALGRDGAGAAPLRSEWPVQLRWISEQSDRLAAMLGARTSDVRDQEAAWRADAVRHSQAVEQFERLHDQLNAASGDGPSSLDQAARLVSDLVDAYANYDAIIAPARSDWPEGYEALFAQLDRLVEVYRAKADERDREPAWRDVATKSAASKRRSLRMRQGAKAVTGSGARLGGKASAAAAEPGLLRSTLTFLDGVRSRLGMTNIQRDVDALKQCEFFDEAWYLETYPDVQQAGQEAARHFLVSGFKEMRAPGPAFCVVSYLKDHPDVARSGLNPLLHYIRHGREEQRKVQPVQTVSGSGGL